MTAPTNPPAPQDGDRPPPEPAPLTWVGEVARMAQHIVDSNARTIRACIVIAVAAAAWVICR